MTEKTIGDAWARYRDKVLPGNASEVQLSGTEMAFYAGAGVMFEAITSGVDEGMGEPTEREMDMVEGLHQEIHDWVAIHAHAKARA